MPATAADRGRSRVCRGGRVSQRPMPDLLRTSIDQQETVYLSEKYASLLIPF
ncbi:unnamed protein product [Anisakis simplex]|uniref:Uncharacterized protein n=1 Tax=Anisakis simplex TaxID=6269 RepID=A0A0M3JF84_ANISI|nr:unnamed protein product [Anisakis simplex]